jgi:TrpR-related protein YerC/YecD
MAQVSRRRLHPNTEEKIYNTFWEAISQLKSEQEISLFLNDLLSPTEKVMLAKRLAIAALLTKGYTYVDIKDLLKVSQETISKVSLSLNINTGYQLAINKIAKSEATRAFWQDIGSAVYRMSSPGKAFMAEGAIRHKLGHRKKTLV